MPQKLNGKDVLIKVSGPDHPGITSELMSIIKATNNSLLDMGQSVTHGLLSLSFVINISEENNEHDHVLKDLLFAANNLNLTLDYKVVEPKSKSDKTEKFILNCVSVEPISAAFMCDIATILSGHGINIKRIDKVSPNAFKSLEISTQVPVGLNYQGVKAELLKTSNGHKVDVAFLKDDIFRRSKRLIVFDMDSTLIQTEVIDELADACGVGEEVREITEAAMNGEINFNESLIQRVSKLEGLEASKMQDILDKLPLTQGVEDFIHTIKMLGYKVAVISGGFTFFANALKEKLGLDYAFANELEIVGGKLTGKVLGTIINAEQKALLVKLIAQQENISLEQVVAIGDGANDLPMLATAGLGIAFHAKEVVRKEAEQHMSHGPMTSILYFLGITDSSELL
ncbi:phosphoserine phosphatase SerB [Halobacteriovorax sp. JY17]|uniref:phosphoserine phosphatase SerB n=1 Tax=Halobacteriovorax sp. JY17 TaxID=2014617 RepID=UPI000C373C5C|nr:phosphoserine phosphatase SerB [Halobacteriovorax sp. JY17]PIK15548.1 MAG: phosphoserine phosphatase SerB [Halobacteriovorax sp. JY17]